MLFFQKGLQPAHWHFFKSKSSECCDGSVDGVIGWYLQSPSQIRQLNAWISQGLYTVFAVCVVVSECLSSTQPLLTIFNDGHSLLTKVLCANGSVISLKHQKPLFGIKVCKQTDDPENRGSFSTDTSRKELSPIRICAFSMMGNSNSN